MNVRLTQIDGKLPNLALMRLSAYHRDRGDAVSFRRSVTRELFEPNYGAVYGSAIFMRSQPLVDRLQQEFPGSIIGGTGTTSKATVEGIAGAGRYAYNDYPDFTASIGFTARGCRLKCGFCVVHGKEGKPDSVATVAEIWRGAPHPKHLHLLDNDFFGQPRDQWKARLTKIREGGFRVCFNQGINIRLIDDEISEELAATPYYDDSFKTRRLYTAWDNLKDESIFVRGAERLFARGIKPDHLMVYMLVGYDKAETWERIFHRFDRMRAMGVRPFPMVFDPERKDLKDFQRWVIRRHYHSRTFKEYLAEPEGRRLNLHMATRSLFGEAAEAREQTK